MKIGEDTILLTGVQNATTESDESSYTSDRQPLVLKQPPVWSFCQEDKGQT